KLGTVHLRERLAECEGRVCRVELDGSPAGTGFLVGPDLVLTSYHVIEPAVKSRETVTLACRFDYKLSATGIEPSAILIEVMKCQWLASSSPHLFTAEEREAFEKPLPEHLSKLDYALIRLARRLGNEMTSLGSPRGWFTISAAPAAIPRISIEKNDPGKRS